MADVELRNVTKAYGDTRVIHGIDLSIRSGEFVVFVGPSGCGKSTLLRMIAGLEAITGGEIAIDGKVVNDLPPRARDIAMVFQDYALYPHKTVYENMAFGLRLRKRPEQEVRTRVGDAANEWNVIMATAILAMIPPTLVVLLMQRWFIKGLVDSEK